MGERQEKSKKKKWLYLKLCLGTVGHLLAPGWRHCGPLWLVSSQGNCWNRGRSCSTSGSWQSGSGAPFARSAYTFCVTCVTQITWQRMRSCLYRVSLDTPIGHRISSRLPAAGFVSLYVDCKHNKTSKWTGWTIVTNLLSDCSQSAPPRHSCVFTGTSCTRRHDADVQPKTCTYQAPSSCVSAAKFRRSLS